MYKVDKKENSNHVVSIIMPAYNADRYLDEAISSVLSQSDSDWELLIVDDGSSDATGDIIDRYAAEDARIRVWHQENAGMSVARNVALDNARGDLLAFIDADDVMHPDFLKIMKEGMAQSGTKMVIGAAEWFDGESKLENIYHLPDGKLSTVDSHAAVEDALYQRKYDNAVWGKLYARQLWGDLRFQPGIGYEDLDLFYRLWLPAQKIGVVDVALYGYRQHEESYMHTFSMRRTDSLDVADRLCSRLGNKSEALRRGAEVRRFAAYYNILTLLYANDADAPDVEKDCMAVVKKESRKVLVNSKARMLDRFGALIAIIGGKKAIKMLAKMRKRVQ